MRCRCICQCPSSWSALAGRWLDAGEAPIAISGHAQGLAPPVPDRSADPGLTPGCGQRLKGRITGLHRRFPVQACAGPGEPCARSRPAAGRPPAAYPHRGHTTMLRDRAQDVATQPGPIRSARIETELMARSMSGAERRCLMRTLQTRRAAAPTATWPGHHMHLAGHSITSFVPSTSIGLPRRRQSARQPSVPGRARHRARLQRIIRLLSE